MVSREIENGFDDFSITDGIANPAVDATDEIQFGAVEFEVEFAMELEMAEAVEQGTILFFLLRTRYYSSSTCK